VTHWKLWVSFGVAVLLAAAGVGVAYMWWLADPTAGPVEGQWSVVTQGSLTERVQAAGTVASPEQTALSFGMGGRIVSVHVAEGDTIESGALIAQLDTTDLDMAVAQAESVLALTIAQRAQLGREPLDSEIEAAQLAVEAAQARLAQMKIGPRAGEIASAEASLRSAEASYRQLLVGPTEDELKVLKASVDQAEIARNQAQGEYDRYAWRSGFEASPQAAALQQATIGYDQTMAAYNLASAPPTQDTLERAQAVIAEARSQLERLLDGTTADELKAADAAIAQAQAALDRLEAPPAAEDLAVAEVRITQAEQSVVVAKARQAMATLRAPVGGTVVSVPRRVGEVVNAGTPIIMVADLAEFNIEAQVSDLYVGRVQSGQTAQVFLDAYPKQTLYGVVGDIDPLPASGIASYAVDIVVNDPGVTLRPAMSGLVEIITSQAPDAVLVDKGALTLRHGQWLATVLRQGTIDQVSVEIAGKDGRQVQVLSGLSPGDQVLLHTAAPLIAAGRYAR